jgi:putative inorganic carbon (HCO3(-)) transporter
MLHQFLFFLVFFGSVPAIIMSPFAGTIVYKWLEYLPPGLNYQMSLLPDRLSFFIGALTFLCWLFREKKGWPRPPSLMIMLILFFLWINVTTYFALVPADAQWQWNRTVKTIGFAVLTGLMLRNRPRIEAAIWIQVVCVAYSSIPGMLKTFIGGGGGNVVTGAAGSFIEDRVAFAVLLPMIVPLALFLAKHSTLIPLSRWPKRAMQGIAASCCIALIGTFARTALFSGAAALIMLTVKSKRKVIAVVVACAVVGLGYTIAPESWLHRMEGTENYQQDASAEARLEAWGWAWNMAVEHPVFGGGFKAFELNRLPNGVWLEAHNIFFEVVSEHGFPGAILFFGMIFIAYHSCSVAARKARGRAELDWAADLARMLQAGLLAFVAGGMFISIATNPPLYDWAALVIGLRSLVERETAKSRVRSPVPGSAAAAMLPAQ